MGDDESMDLEWEDEQESTRITDSSKIADKLKREIQRDRAYLIVLAGGQLGKVYRLEQGATILGRSAQADIRFDDDSISRQHATLRISGTQVELLDNDSSNGTLVNGLGVRYRALQDGDKLRLGDTTVLKFTYHDQIDEHFQARMYEAALRDPLTRAYNKRFLAEHLSKEVKFARRHHTKLSMLMIDLDHFKNINDTYGHPTGDQVLVQLAELAHNMIRGEDVVARYGGEEFAVVLRDISLEDAAIAAERLRVSIRATAFIHGDTELPVTASIGVATLMPHMKDPQELIAAADSALYAAKAAGRNRVMVNQTP